MSDLRTVLRPISADGVTLKSGEVVDVSGWRNLEALVRMGKIGVESIAPQVKKPRSKTTSTKKEVSDHVDL